MTGDPTDRLARLDGAELQLLRHEAPALIAEAKRTATAEDIERVLTPLVAVFGVSDAAQTRVFWRAYHQVLSSLHPEALERAAAKWLETGKFFPKPAELRDIARTLPLRCVLIATHARAALSYRRAA